jgi:hypothetical protein
MQSRADRRRIQRVSGAGTASALATLLLGGVLALSTCDGSVQGPPPSEVGGAGGIDGAAGSGGVPDECVVPTDGVCGPDDCGCLACMGTATCVEDGCRANGICELAVAELPALDACTCSDCDWNAPCIELGSVVCDLDGACDHATESCGCADCFEVETCADNVLACDGPPDGMCVAAAESCECADCIALEECFPCKDDGLCGFSEPCLCDDCASVCAPIPCENDGVCNWYLEGCSCFDCASLSICAPPG